MELGLDLSEINLSHDPDGITLAEIVSVLNKNLSGLIEIKGYPKVDFLNY